MPGLVIKSNTDVFNLSDYENDGVQILSGLTGLGLPPVSLQWVEGAGDGAVLRGSRVTARDLDLPLQLKATNREGLKELVRRFSLMFSDVCTLSFVEDDSISWSTEVVRVGGGTFTYGVDTRGENDLFTVVTVRAGDPFFTSSQAIEYTIGSTPAPPILSNLAALKLSSGQAFGSVKLDNSGTHPAHALWTIKGPGTNFLAISPSGERLNWKGTLAAGETLYIDTAQGTVIDGTGASRYSALAAAPRFWQVPPGAQSATASLDGATVASSITVKWWPRRTMVI